MYRFMPAVRIIKEEIEEKSIGEIIDFKIKLYHKSYLDENKKASWRTGTAPVSLEVSRIFADMKEATTFEILEQKEA